MQWKCKEAGLISGVASEDFHHEGVGLPVFHPYLLLVIVIIEAMIVVLTVMIVGVVAVLVIVKIIVLIDAVGV